MEIRHIDLGISVANCPLMDPDELPDRGWSATKKLAAGGWIDLVFHRDTTEDGQDKAILMKVRYRTRLMSGVATALGGASDLLGWFRRVPELIRPSLRSARGVAERLGGRRQGAPRPLFQPLVIGILLIALLAQQYRYLKERAEHQALAGVVGAEEA